MKKLIKCILVLMCGFICVASLVGCVSKGKSTLLGAPHEALALEYSEMHKDGLRSLRNFSNQFAADFTAAAYHDYPIDQNFTVAPISVYMALALAAECSGGTTQTELLTALGTPLNLLQSDFSNLYRSLAQEFKRGSKTTGQLSIGNSIWLNEGTTFNQSCIQNLADQYFCHSYVADFASDNRNANLAIRHFVKEQTKSLIDQDFNLDIDTLFTLINTLYLKDIWNQYGDKLPYTEQEYAFINQNGDTTHRQFIQGYYNNGQIHEEESFTSFYTQTQNGYKIKFLLPKDGYSVGDIFTPANIELVNAIIDYRSIDGVNMLQYHTRCLFPEFNASSDTNLKSILQSTFGINSLFDPQSCDFSTLTDNAIYCGEVRHITKLSVDRRGIEGAAVTVIPGVGSAEPGEYTKVYNDFILDRAFGFILTDRYDTTLFSGVIHTI